MLLECFSPKKNAGKNFMNSEGWHHFSVFISQQQLVSVTLPLLPLLCSELQPVRDVKPTLRPVLCLTYGPKQVLLPLLLTALFWTASGGSVVAAELCQMLGEGLLPTSVAVLKVWREEGRQSPTETRGKVGERQTTRPSIRCQLLVTKKRLNV